MAHTTGLGGTPSLQTILSGSERVSGERNAAPPATNTAKSSYSPDKAALSSTGGTLSKVALQDADDVRTAKVDQIRTSIANGSYQVPASAVADKLLKHLLG